MFKIIVPLLFVISSLAQAQFARSSNLELSCVHLNPVQAKYLEKHVNYSKLNKNLESKTIQQFVKRLDGSKLYLLDKDAKDIEKMMDGIFDKVRNKDCDAIDKANALFVQRVEERVNYAKKYWAPNSNMSPPLKIQRDPQDRPRPKTFARPTSFHETYMSTRASYSATDMKLEEAKQQIIRNYERALKRVQEYKREDLLSSYLDSFARVLIRIRAICPRTPSRILKFKCACP